MWLRSRCVRNVLVSPIESKWVEYVSTNPSKKFSDFLADRKPDIVAPIDVIYLSGMIESAGSVNVPPYLETAANAIELKLVSSGVLSVMAGRLGRVRKWMPDFREKVERELMERSDVEPRLLLRLPKDVIRDKLIDLLNKKVEQINEYSLNDLLRIMEVVWGSDEELALHVDRLLLHRAAFATPPQAVEFLSHFASHSPTKFTDSIITHLKKVILAGREDMNRDLRIRAVAALSRVGAFNDTLRSLLPRKQLSARDVTLIAAVGRDDIQEMLSRVMNAESSYALQAAHALLSQGKEIPSEQISALVEKYLQKEVLSPEEELIVAEMYFVNNGATKDIPERIQNILSQEQTRMMSCPTVRSVLAHFQLDSLSPLSSSCPFPVIVSGDTFFDVDSYPSPCNRSLRAKISASIKYKVIDPLSWHSAEFKSEYISALTESDSPFLRNSPTQLGSDLAVDVQPNRPKWAYIRKIDLK